MEKKQIYTLGYTSFQNRFGVDVEKMFSILKEFDVNFLIDVRSIPFSKQYPQCNANYLKIAGKQLGVTYAHMPELGAKANDTQDVFSKASDIFFENIFPISKSNRPERTELLANEEIVDFNKFRHDEYFLQGIKRIESAYDKGFTLTLMCSEKNPMDCHRYFLISKALEQRYGDWLEVKHICNNQNGDICTISNDELNKQLEDVVFNKKEIKYLDVLSPSIMGPAIIEKYYGETNQDKKSDFCDRYWNLMHGWKKVNNSYNSNNNDYD